MMRIVYFEQKDELLSHLGALPGEKQFITPSPAKADGLRSRLPGTSDVITIAKFTSNLLELLWEEGDTAPQVKRKSELLLVMGLMKNKYLPELGYEQFIQAWNLFSDLRSFTLDFDALNSVMESQPEIIRKAVQVFWAILSTGELCDEHGAYHAIAEKLRSSEEYHDLKKTFIFWGFQHLNGQQVDLLKALAIRYDVVIPFPLALRDELRRSDWPLWVKDHRTAEDVLPGKAAEPTGKVTFINSREIASSLRKLAGAGTQVVLGVSRLRPVHIHSIPFANVNFKIGHEILSDEIFLVASELTENLPATCSSSELVSFLDKLKKATIAKRDYSFKLLRAIQLYEEAFAGIRSLTDEEITIDEFYQKLIRDVALLNQPRTSFAPLNAAETQIDLKDMSSLEDIPAGKDVIICIDERFEDIQSLSQNYTESIQKELSAIGPLKRNELELLFRKWEFRSLFTRASVHVLMPEGVLKHNLIWKRLFEELETVLTRAAVPPSGPRAPLRDQLADHPKKKYTGHFSASSLQTFLDCPQKFYFNYVENLSPDITIQSDIDPMLSGTISHKIIEVAHERRADPGDLSEVTTEIFNHYIQLNKLVLPQDTYDRHHLIFRQRAANGLLYLRELEHQAGEKISWKMETSFKVEGENILSGKIDCIGEGQKRIYLLDFKSSASSAGTATEISSFENLQLWVYSLAARGLIRDFDKKEVVIGYVVLKSPEDSILAMSDQELQQKLKELDFTKVTLLEKSFTENLKDAEQVIQSLILAIRKEEAFPSRPADASSCLYCQLSRICTKGALNVANS